MAFVTPDEWRAAMATEDVATRRQSFRPHRPFYGLGQITTGTGRSRYVVKAGPRLEGGAFWAAVAAAREAREKAQALGAEIHARARNVELLVSRIKPQVASAQARARGFERDPQVVDTLTRIGTLWSDLEQIVETAREKVRFYDDAITATRDWEVQKRDEIAWSETYRAVERVAGELDNSIQEIQLRVRDLEPLLSGLVDAVSGVQESQRQVAAASAAAASAEAQRQAQAAEATRQGELARTAAEERARLEKQAADAAQAERTRQEEAARAREEAATGRASEERRFQLELEERRRQAEEARAQRQVELEAAREQRQVELEERRQAAEEAREARALEQQAQLEYMRQQADLQRALMERGLLSAQAAPAATHGGDWPVSQGYQYGAPWQAPGFGPGWEPERGELFGLNGLGVFGALTVADYQRRIAENQSQASAARARGDTARERYYQGQIAQDVGMVQKLGVAQAPQEPGIFSQIGSGIQAFLQPIAAGAGQALQNPEVQRALLSKAGMKLPAPEGYEYDAYGRMRSVGPSWGTVAAIGVGAGALLGLAVWASKKGEPKRANPPRRCNRKHAPRRKRTRR